MNFQELLAFTIATLGETFSPGPTIALLLASRAAGRMQAWGVVLGVTLANVGWALAATVTNRETAASAAVDVVITVGAGVLVYFVSRGLVRSIVEFIAGLEPTTAGTASAVDLRDGIKQGFIAHAANPSSISYYSGLYAASTLNQPLVVPLLLGGIAVACDFVVYGLWASLPKFSEAAWPRGVRLSSRFATDMALLYIIVLAFCRSTESSEYVIGSMNVIAMMVGLLFGAASEGSRLVRMVESIAKASTWKVVALWQGVLTVLAIVGTAFTVVAGLERSTADSNETETAFRLCVLVAAVFAGAAGLAKALGELQATRRDPSVAASSAYKLVESNAWLKRNREKPIFVWFSSVSALVVLFALLITMRLLVEASN